MHMYEADIIHQREKLKRMSTKSRAQVQSKELADEENSHVCTTLGGSCDVQVPTFYLPRGLLVKKPVTARQW